MRKTMIICFLLVVGMTAGDCLNYIWSADKDVKAYILLDEEDEISSWENAEENTDYKQKGKCSVRWVGAERGTRFSTTSMPQDCSQYNLVSFWLYSEVANNAKIVFNFVSENEATEGGDYFHYQIPINWKGWKKMEVPFSSFGKARTPVGWNKIDRVEFYSKGWGIEPKEDTVLYFDDIRLEKSASVSAEPISKKEPKKEVKLDKWDGKLRYVGYPWEEIFNLVKKDSSIASFLQSVVDYAKTKIKEPIARRPYKLKEIPSGWLDGRAKYAGKNEEIFALAMSDCGASQHLLGVLLPIAIAARYSGDKTCINYAIEQLKEVCTWSPLQRPGWTQYNPDSNLPPGGDGNWLGTGWSIHAIVEVLDVMGDLVPEELKKNLKELLQKEIDSIVDDWKVRRPWFVRGDFPSTNQWVLPNAGLLYACLFLGDEKNKEAYELGVYNLSRTCEAQGEDGSWCEGYGYGSFSAEYIFWPAWAMKRNADSRFINNSFVKNFSSWLTHMTMPGDFIVNAFDCGSYKISNVPHNSLMLSALLIDDKTSVWAINNLFSKLPNSLLGIVYRYYSSRASSTTTEEKPIPYAFFSSQQVLTWRTDWNQKTAMGLWLRGGSSNDFHSHRDNGHISLYNGIAPILIECGTPNYADRELDTKYAQAAGHNILQAQEVLPRGKGCEVLLKVEKMNETSGFVIIDGTRAYTNVDEWTRKVEWNKEGWVKIEDKVLLKNEMDIEKEWFRFHTASVKPLNIEGKKNKWGASWEDAEIEFEAKSPIVVEQIEWPDRSTSAQKHMCLLIKSEKPADKMELKTYIVFKRRETMISKLIPYNSYISSLKEKFKNVSQPKNFIVLEAEGMVAGGGAVASDKKIGAKVCIYNWNDPGQKIEKEINIMEEGFYRVLIKYCTACALGIPDRSLYIDDKIPFREVGSFIFHSTQGDTPSDGWSNKTNDWKFKEIADIRHSAESRPSAESRHSGSGRGSGDGFLFYFSKGKHKLTMVNEGGGGLNVDYLVLLPEGMNREEVINKLEAGIK